MSEEKRAMLAAELGPYLSGREQIGEPACRFFESCGGCHLQHMSYADQLAVKARILRAVFASEGLECPLGDPDIHGMKDPWYYRNKADFNAKVYGGELRIGFTQQGGRRVLDVDQCPISSQPINEALRALKQALPEFPELKRKLHSVILRSGTIDDRAVALYHTKLKDIGVFNRLTARVRELAPRLSGGAYVRRGKSYGSGELALRERIAGIEFRYSPPSFFQANPAQTELLCRVVEEYADPMPSDVCLDVYSGVGLFTLLLAPSVREVYAIEDTPVAVSDAMANAMANSVSNCRFLRGQAEERLTQLARLGIRPTLAVLDPPRSGCSPKVLRQVAHLLVGRIVYVSCNPRALARDLKLLEGLGYRPTALSLVDMFPQTLHLETVARVSLTGR